MAFQDDVSRARMATVAYLFYHVPCPTLAVLACLMCISDTMQGNQMKLTILLTGNEHYTNI